jgi:serine/threonine protein kinase
MAEYQPMEELVSGYTVVHPIGQGGQATVYLAEREHDGLRVALKVLDRRLRADAIFRERFVREYKLLASLDNEHVARIYDQGFAGDQAYIAMEFLPSGTLATRIHEGLSTRAALRLTLQIARALDAIHEKGIVHRDLKPANVLVTMVDARPVPKVIDFGVAKATGGKLTDDTLATQFGAVLGTLEYMAPEQAGYSQGDVDTRADIYSLGVILYELLTGLRPFDAQRLKKAAVTEMVRIIHHEEPSKPSTRLSTDEALPSLAALRQTEPKKLMAMLRGELDWVVMKCLEKQRDRRYETANSLARDLQRYLADEEVEARPPSAGYRLRKFVSRNQGQVIAGSLLLVALIVGMIGTSWGFFNAETERRAADRARINAQNQKKVADANAQKADANARKFEVQLAQGLISQGDAFSLAKRYLEARALYEEAYDKFVQLREPLVAAELGLWSCYDQTEFPLLSLSGHTEAVSCVAITPDGRTALSGSDDNTLKLWDLASGQELRTFTGHEYVVTCVAISPNGDKAVSGSGDKTLKVWDLSSGKELRTFTGHLDRVTSVAIAPDGLTALSSSEK